MNDQTADHGSAHFCIPHLRRCMQATAFFRPCCLLKRGPLASLTDVGRMVLHDVHKAVAFVTAVCDPPHFGGLETPGFFTEWIAALQSSIVHLQSPNARCLCVSVADKKRRGAWSSAPLRLPGGKRSYLPMVKSTLVLPATLTTCDVVLPLCHTNALYCPSGTF